MRISDWSSDVCSSDLERIEAGGAIVAGPILIFARRGRIDDPGDMPRSREQEGFRSRQMIHQPPDAGERRDMILAPRLDIGGRGDLPEVDRGAARRQAVRYDQPIGAVEGDPVLPMPSRRPVGDVRSEEPTSE